MRAYSSIGVEKYITLGFLSVLLAGTLFLWGTCRLGGVGMSPADSLFMSASAVCVTGFSTVENIAALPLPSQIVILILVQFGGVGIMGAATILSMMTGQRLGLRHRLFIAGEIGVDSPVGVLGVLRFVFIYTVSFELAGACLYYPEFSATGLSPGMSAYYSIFHSVSSFCSSGLSLYPDSLERFNSAFLIPATTMTLMTIGGIGFPVMAELGDLRRGRIKFLSPYSKIVLVSTAAFTAMGVILFALFEGNGAFSGMPLPTRMWNALFACVSARGGGFRMVPFEGWSPEGTMITLFFMFIGAAPFSTAGGLKITTFAVLLLAALSELKQEEDIAVYGRKIPYSTVRRALALAFIYILTLFIAVCALSKLERFPFDSIVFDAVSALGTTGLSSGITEGLSTAGKIVIVLLMFWGRVGILTFSYSLVAREKQENVRFPETNIPIG
ncbi:MAG: potassium transporter Trk [Synergistaceae bacterium]|jgi:trk system potassium uptake protein TrkH|nr:potassium transporter Trk [Synergistaceae bacterium]